MQQSADLRGKRLFKGKDCHSVALIGNRLLTLNKSGGRQDRVVSCSMKYVSAEQETKMQALTARLDEQAAQIQNVSDQLEGSRAVARLVENR